MKVITRADFGDPIDWISIVDAIDDGHGFPKAEIVDVFLGPANKTLLSRAAWIEGLGYAVKSVTAVPENRALGLPTVQGAMLVFDDTTGSHIATIDSGLITDLKTAADSALGARYLARSNSRTHLVIGAGVVAGNVIEAYRQVFVSLDRVLLWSRTRDGAVRLAERMSQRGISVEVVGVLAQAVADADIITTATMSSTPLLHGDWVVPGTHVDLIGAFRADMREADDTLLQKSRLFVDSRDTTLHHIGELKIPLDSGAITESDILADLYQLRAGAIGRSDASDITVFKNGGGAHLDLMTAQAILGRKGHGFASTIPTNILR